MVGSDALNMPPTLNHAVNHENLSWNDSYYQNPPIRESQLPINGPRSGGNSHSNNRIYYNSKLQFSAIASQPPSQPNALAKTRPSRPFYSKSHEIQHLLDIY